MNIGQRKTGKVNTIGETRFCLTIIVGSSIDLEFRSLGILTLIVAEISDKNLERLVGLKVEQCSLLALAIAIVFRGIPYGIGLVVIPAVLLVVDRKALKMVDYPLLLTFVFFFIFAGNMARVYAVRELFSVLLEKSTLLFSVVSCQFISNVPSAILLSQFTENYADLLVVVNIGGTGTLIASLASLITFKEYSKCEKGKTGRYLLLFSALNFGMLIVLGTVAYFTL